MRKRVIHVMQGELAYDRLCGTTKTAKRLIKSSLRRSFNRKRSVLLS